MQRVQEKIEDVRDEWETDQEKHQGPILIELEQLENYAQRNAQTRGPVEGFTYPRVRWKR